MQDTSPKIAAQMKQMLLERSPLERLTMGCSMHDFSKQLVKASILNKDPNISKSGLAKELFLRFYGNDFNEQDRDKICAHLTKHVS